MVWSAISILPIWAGEVKPQQHYWSCHYSLPVARSCLPLSMLISSWWNQNFMGDAIGQVDVGQPVEISLPVAHEEAFARASCQRVSDHHYRLSRAALKALERMDGIESLPMLEFEFCTRDFRDHSRALYSWREFPQSDRTRWRNRSRFRPKCGGLVETSVIITIMMMMIIIRGWSVKGVGG